MIAISTALLAATALLAGCASSSSSSAAAPPATAAAATYPVTVTSCGVPVTYDAAPTRAVSIDIGTTEDMLALGLESHMVGDFAIGNAPAGQPLPP